MCSVAQFFDFFNSICNRDLSENRLTTLQNDSFSGLVDLKKMWVWDNLLLLLKFPFHSATDPESPYRQKISGILYETPCGASQTHQFYKNRAYSPVTAFRKSFLRLQKFQLHILTATKTNELTSRPAKYNVLYKETQSIFLAFAWKLIKKVFSISCGERNAITPRKTTTPERLAIIDFSVVHQWHLTRNNTQFKQIVSLYE